MVGKDCAILCCHCPTKKQCQNAGGSLVATMEHHVGLPVRPRFSPSFVCSAGARCCEGRQVCVGLLDDCPTD